MSGISAAWKRLFLRSLLWSAEEAGISLFDALKDAAKAKLEATGDGPVLVGSSANGASVTYQLPSSGPTPSDLVGLIAQLLDLYYLAVAELGSEANDSELVEWMMGRIRSIRHLSSNFRGLQK